MIANNPLSAASCAAPEALLRVAAVILTAMFSFCAHASDISSEMYAVADTDSLYRMLEEVDVVAVKQNRELSQTAASGNVVGPGEIERLQIADIKGVSAIVPNFYIPDYGSRITSSIYVRGIGARMDQPAVGLNIDNVGIMNKDAYDLELNDIASIEMIRGPQATLYGRNTMTGLINVRTLSPMQFQGWRGAVAYSSGNTVKAHAGWYHKFNPYTAMSVTAGYTHSDGRFVNEYNGRKIDRENSGQARVRFHWSPVANMQMTNVLAASLLAQGGYPYEYSGTGSISYNDTCFYKRFLLTDGLSISGRIGGLELLSVTSVQHINDNMTLDQDFLPIPYFTLTQKKNETSLTEDIMLKGKELDGDYKWLVGAYGFFRHLSMRAPVTFKDAGIATLIESHRNDANPHHPISWDTRQFTLGSDFTLPSGGFAVYHESTFETGRWHLTAGLRFDYERVDLKYYSHCDTGYTIFDNPSGELPMPADAGARRHVDVSLEENGRLHRSYFMCLPKVTALYDFPSLNSSNVYASVGSGYKAGGFNTQMFSDVLQQKLMGMMGISSKYDVNDIVGYKPEKSWTFEVGSHLQFPELRLRADIALFCILCRDQQLTTFPDGTTTGRMMTNAGRTRSVGGEISISCNPIEPLSFSGSYGFTDARFTEYFDGKVNYAGKRLPYAPSNTLNLNGVYMLRGEWLKSSSIEISAGVTGVGDIFWNEANTRHQPFYAQMSASVTFRAPLWNIELWGSNLTGTKFKTFYFLSMGNEFFQRGEPRTIGVTASFVF